MLRWDDRRTFQSMASEDGHRDYRSNGRWSTLRHPKFIAKASTGDVATYRSDPFLLRRGSRWRDRSASLPLCRRSSSGVRSMTLSHCFGQW